MFTILLTVKDVIRHQINQFFSKFPNMKQKSDVESSLSFYHWNK